MTARTTAVELFDVCDPCLTRKHYTEMDGVEIFTQHD